MTSAELTGVVAQQDLRATPAAADGRDEWWRSAVIYQIYPRSFADADGDGIGDLRGIIDRLDHLADLGVDAVWLCPVYASPGADNGYDISDYRSVDPMYGTLADLDELIAHLHRRGMRLVLDMVVNHTSDRHPWFLESSASRDNPRRDWYWWRPPRTGHRPGQPGAEPSNWESFFSGPAWSLDDRTGEYFLHLFAAAQPDLNWENPQVRAAIYDVMRWWLDRGVDGFRLDVANLYSKDPALPDGPVPAGRRLGDGSGYYIDGPRIHEFLAELRGRVLAGHPDALLVAETPGVGLAAAQRYTDPRSAEVDMVFGFDHVGLDHGPGGKFDPLPVDRTALTAVLDRWQVALAAPCWPSLYWGNHDQPRVVSRFGDDRVWWRESATALASLLYLQRGTVYLFQGDEIGMTNGDFTDISDVRDIESTRWFQRAVAAGLAADTALAGIRAAGRDNARTPVQWTAESGAGFTAGTPWIAVNANHRWLNVAAQRDDPDSVLSHHRRLFELRRAEPVLIHGSYLPMLTGHPSVFGFRRIGRDREFLVLTNLAATPTPVDLSPVHAAGRPAPQLMLSNWPGPCAVDRTVTLRPWESIVLRAQR